MQNPVPDFSQLDYKAYLERFYSLDYRNTDGALSEPALTENLSAIAERFFDETGFSANSVASFLDLNIADLEDLYFANGATQFEWEHFSNQHVNGLLFQVCAGEALATAAGMSMHEWLHWDNPDYTRRFHDMLVDPTFIGEDSPTGLQSAVYAISNDLMDLDLTREQQT